MVRLSEELGRPHLDAKGRTRIRNKLLAQRKRILGSTGYVPLGMLTVRGHSVGAAACERESLKCAAAKGGDIALFFDGQEWTTTSTWTTPGYYSGNTQGSLTPGPGGRVNYDSRTTATYTPASSFKTSEVNARLDCIVFRFVPGMSDARAALKKAPSDTQEDVLSQVSDFLDRKDAHIDELPDFIIAALSETSEPVKP